MILVNDKNAEDMLDELHDLFSATGARPLGFLIYRPTGPFPPETLALEQDFRRPLPSAWKAAAATGPAYGATGPQQSPAKKKGVQFASDEVKEGGPSSGAAIGKSLDVKTTGGGASAGASASVAPSAKELLEVDALLLAAPGGSKVRGQFKAPNIKG